MGKSIYSMASHQWFQGVWEKNPCYSPCLLPWWLVDCGKCAPGKTCPIPRVEGVREDPWTLNISRGCGPRPPRQQKTPVLTCVLSRVGWLCFSTQETNELFLGHPKGVMAAGTKIDQGQLPCMAAISRRNRELKNFQRIWSG